MQPTIEILDRIRKNSRDNKEEIFTRLYRYLLDPICIILRTKTSTPTRAQEQKA